MTGAVAFASGGQHYTGFQQIEFIRSFGRTRHSELAAGGGVRQEFGGTQTVVGRVIAGAALARGRLESNTVMEKTQAARRDSVDVITTFGWSRAINGRVSAGVEGIGQDLEGFWSADEAEGGARLLVGPSLHVASADRRWSFTMAGGPLFRSDSSALAPTNTPRSITGLGTTRGRYAVVGSFTCALAPPR